MPPRDERMRATRLKPLRGFQLLISILLFHLGSFINSNPDIYMTMIMGDLLLAISCFYLSLITVAIMTLREGDAIRTSPMFAFRMLGIPLYISFAIICYFSSTTDFSYWIVKVTLLLCFVLAGSFLVETVIVFREIRR